MKTAIVYYSEHHGDTKKLPDSIAQRHEITLIDLTAEPSAELRGFDCVGLQPAFIPSSIRCKPPLF